MTPNWYLLFDGNSPDGLGQPVFVGQTLDLRVAQKHHAKCLSDPYCTGNVMIINDSRMTQMTTRNLNELKTGRPYSEIDLESIPDPFTAWPDTL